MSDKKWKKYPNFVSTGMLRQRSDEIDVKKFKKQSRELCQTEDEHFNIVEPRAAYQKSMRWPPNSTIYIKFLDGEEWKQMWTKKIVEEEIQPIVQDLIKLKFVNRNEYADVKITFDFDGYGASTIGTRCREVGQNSPSMKIGSLDFPKSRIFEYNSNVYQVPSDIELTTNNSGAIFKHEFGHVFGKIHEHQNPIDNPIQWNVTKVLNYYSKPPNSWPRDDIMNNIVNRLPLAMVEATPFDPLSIMMYTINPELTLNDIGFEKNDDYSEKDLEWLRKHLLAEQNPINWKWIGIASFVMVCIIILVVVMKRKTKRKK